MIGYHFYSNAQRRTLSRLRIAVEWAVGEVKMDEQFAEQFLHNKLQQTMCIRGMRLSVLIRNFFRCMSGSNASLYFDVYPPTLEEYLRWA